MYEPIVDDTLAALAELRVIECMCDGDHTIWKPESTENADRLGWLGAPEAVRDDLARLRRQPCDLSSLSFTHAHVLDIGGSSLALELSERTFRGEGGLELGVLHTSDQSTLLRQSDRLCPKRALCIVATKSGGTAETFSLFKSFYDQVVRNVGEGGVGEHFVAITDPRSLLGNLARLLGFGDAFLGDPSIRGRSSPTSPHRQRWTRYYSGRGRSSETGVGLRGPSATVRASCTRRASSTEAIVEAASSFS